MFNFYMILKDGNEAKGKEIMKKAWVAHGIDSLYAHKVYEFTAVDDWKGPMAGMAKLWPQKNTKLQVKYVPIHLMLS